MEFFIPIQALALVIVEKCAGMTAIVRDLVPMKVHGAGSTTNRKITLSEIMLVCILTIMFSFAELQEMVRAPTFHMFAKMVLYSYCKTFYAG